MFVAQKTPIDASIMREVEKKGSSFPSFASASKKLFRQARLFAFAARYLQHEARQKGDMELAESYDRAASAYAKLYVDVSTSSINKVIESLKFRDVTIIMDMTVIYKIQNVYKSMLKTLKRLHLDETQPKTAVKSDYGAKRMTANYSLAIDDSYGTMGIDVADILSGGKSLDNLLKNIAKDAEKELY